MSRRTSVTATVERTRVTAKALARKGEPRPPLTIIDACEDPKIFAPWFKDRATWAAWFVFLRAMFGLGLDADGLAIFRACTGRSEPRPGGYLEATLVVGRRGGKSLILALIAAFLSAFYDWSLFLTGGERGTIMIIATDRRQAATIFKYLKEMLSIPLLAGLIQRETADTIDLSNGITVEIQTASFRTIRGRTVVAGLCDELAFWMGEDSANPDKEIIGALRPASATVPGALLLKASSPYARRGVLWDDHRKHFGNDDSQTLVWQAATRTMNPSIAQSFIDSAVEDDPSAAAAEYFAQFRSDVESFISREAVEAVTSVGVLERGHISGQRYYSFVDPSGGSSDSMTLAIAHMEQRNSEKTVILDAIREVRAPFSPEQCVDEFATLLKLYGITAVSGDRYAGMWPRERFKVHGINYEVSEKTKNDIYRDLLPIINSRQCDLLDHPRLFGQLVSLERRTARGGRDSIDHPPGAHDDVANAVGDVALRVLECGDGGAMSRSSPAVGRSSHSTQLRRSAWRGTLPTTGKHGNKSGNKW